MPQPYFYAPAVVLAAVVAAVGCRPPPPAVALGPHGHGAYGRTPGPMPVAWRANVIAAPCALTCRGAGPRDIACTCTGVDSIYFSRLDEGWRLGMAEAETGPAVKTAGQPPDPPPTGGAPARAPEGTRTRPAAGANAQRR